MSVYGGFGTRLQETAYGRLAEGLIYALQQHAVSVLKGESIDEEEWVKYVYSILAQMEKFEKNKYLPPKYSTSCKDLLELLRSKDYTNRWNSLLNSSVKSKLRLPKLTSSHKSTLIRHERHESKLSQEDEKELHDIWEGKSTSSPEKARKDRDLTPPGSYTQRAKDDSPVSARKFRDITPSKN